MEALLVCFIFLLISDSARSASALRQKRSDPAAAFLKDEGGTEPGKEEIGSSPAPTYDISLLLPPNDLVDTALSIVRIVFEQVDNLAPAKSIEVPLVEKSISIPLIGFHLPLGTKVKLKDGTIYGLQSVVRNGEATLRKEGRVFIIAGPVLVKFVQINYTMEFQVLFLSFRERVVIDANDISINAEVRAIIELPNTGNLNITRFEVTDVGDMRLRLESSRKAAFNGFLNKMLRKARVSFRDVIFNLLADLGKDALEKAADKGIREINELTR
ncbi:unnamed protein product [Darwinula stevensoni]|uniref:Uncharacterized protein n=1 Tax=Darwinula stevensoni TaxID=69355 RepID=A0A7R9AFY9_9CRUS|nr:unnamed protein product [Darwinula stevensoni]CAG0903722.1 unnamed protein product [Darwinula stevensoni]